MYLYGASGHGKVIKDILASQGILVDGFIDDNPNINELSGLPVLHSTENIDQVIVSVGFNSTRKIIVEKLNCDFSLAAIHASAILSESAYVDRGTVVMAGVIVNADAKIGKHCIVNTGASVDHDCVLEDYVHISPHATLCGNVHIGEGSWIGAGATVIQGIKIGRWCVIGAGSVVTKDVPNGYLAVGNRCKLIKQITKEIL